MHLNQRADCQVKYGQVVGLSGTATKSGIETRVFDVMVNQPVEAPGVPLPPPEDADDDSNVVMPMPDTPDGSVFADVDTEARMQQGWEEVRHNDPNVTYRDKDDQLFTFTNEHRVEVSLLKLLHALGAPLFAFKEIMEWAADAYHSEYKFNPDTRTHHGQIKELQKWTNMTCLRPSQEIVTLAGDNLQLPVVRFDFIASLFSLFHDTTINRLENLAINPANPFGRYVSPDGLLGDVNSGAFYDMAYANLVTDPNKDFLACIIMQMDKTTVSEAAHLHSHPVMFTLSCFNLERRNQTEAWRPLGFIPIESNYYSSAQWKKFTANQKHVRFQQMCNILLKELIAAQVPGALDNVVLSLGPYEKLVNLKIPVAFIIGDAQGGDFICSRSLTYNGMIAERACRTCDVGRDSMGLAELNMCRRIIQADVEALIAAGDVEGLIALCQHACDNAFFKLCYGGSPFGVFTAAAPTEGLHQLEKGLILLCLQELFDQRLPLSLKKQLDTLVQSFIDLPRQRGMKSFRDHFPRLLFKDGITHLSNITATTVVGVMFTTIVAGLTREGRRLFHSKECTRMDGDDYFDMIEVFESLLCFWAWLKKDTYWKCGDAEATKTAEIATCTLMTKLRTLWSRTSGHGWDNPKTHETYHNALNIFMFGCHKNWHSGPSEHHHIARVKTPSKITQKRAETFDLQIANRLVDQYCTEYAYNRIQTAELRYLATLVGEHPVVETIDEVKVEAAAAAYTSASKFSIHMIRIHGSSQPQITYRWQTRSARSEALDPFLISHIVTTCFIPLTRESQLLGLSLTGSFEYKRNNQVFRTHQNYRQGGPYNDFAFMTWERDVPNEMDIETSSDDESDKSDNVSDFTATSTLEFAVEASDQRTTKQVLHIPAKLLCFLQFPNGEECILVHSCQARSKSYSVLTTRWRWEYQEEKDDDLTDDEYSINSEDEAETRNDNYNRDDIESEPAHYRDSDDSTGLTPLLRIVSVNVLEKHCLMIPYHPKSKYMMHVLDQDKWANKFLDD